MLKLGSLFDGIGGFPLSATYHGITPVWASEIEPFPIEVTRQHFPNMKHLGDIMQINGAEIEPVDIITFGSPCQDLSVAGKRDGLEGKRSNLFYQAVRIIREMREATNGKYPTFAIWENVPGAFSSNNGQDFRSVLEEITESEIPMPTSGKWATAGMVRGNGRSAAWRVLDAQYWGVPQRRKRIFLVADFTGQRAGEILFEQQGVSGDFAESRKAREEVAAGVGDGVDVAKSYGLVSKGNGEAWITPERHMTLNVGGGQAGQGYPAVVVAPFNTGQVTSPQNGNRVEFGLPCHTLARNEHTPAVIIAGTGQLASGKSAVGTLMANCGTKQWLGNQEAFSGDYHIISAYALQGSMIGRADKNGPQGDGVNKDVSFTLNTTDRHAVAQLYENHSQDTRYKGPLEVAQPVTATYGMGGNNQPFVVKPSTYTVRRLMPSECELLQGFPLGWTDIPGASDTGRYKALGNSVAVPCVAWIIGRVREALVRANLPELIEGEIEKREEQSV